ncbi:MAG TPA: hypothetical protein VIL78_12820 [Hanamia sp.]
MKKLLDLRFVIGMFFTIVGTLLVVYDFVAQKNTKMNTSVNVCSGVLFLLFGIVMIILSYRSKVDEE